MRSHPLYEKNKDLFKMHYPLLFTIRKIFRYEAITIPFIICSYIGACILFMLSLFTFLHSDMLLGVFQMSVLIAGSFLLINKMNKISDKMFDDLSLERKKEFIKSVTEEYKKFLNKKEINNTEFSKKVTGKLEKTMDEHFINILSDNKEFAQKGFAYFLGDNEDGNTFLSALSNLRSDITLMEYEYKESIPHKNSLDIAAKRLKDIKAEV